MDESDAQKALTILKIVHASGRKCTISHARKKLGWTWTRTKNLLLELAASGRINAEQTTFGWIFSVKTEDQLAPVVKLND